ncbi:acyl-CoA N-acyltransferase [Amylocarpus encephaloides]|uniref:histone acetyltransferase n=1 Tax=Amylocarpus encephaloides TaxID=45428 RepID=A0A9P7YIH0_9HELO|nr:acyl-CoA N-acyltransferase [Amylocarpus encephaloides]
MPSATAPNPSPSGSAPPSLDHSLPADVKSNIEAEARKKPAARVISDRNIDNVTFGSLDAITFPAWYRCTYPKQIFGEKMDGRKGIVVNDLYVCNKCFAYSKDAPTWARHCRCCDSGVPGEKIYEHPKNKSWSVWEVDGEQEKLFCQNLSLFAKLFIDSKSVLFDVSSFNYYLLVHAADTGSQQIVGFFSKEKISFEQYNLACILIFPPWQKKGLGNILMAISYAICRMEELPGGPEKPISDLGKKGYLKFWGNEICRYLIGLKETDVKRGNGMIDLERVSRECYIKADDCLALFEAMDGEKDSEPKILQAVENEAVTEHTNDGEEKTAFQHRVRIDKALVRAWAAKEGLDLLPVVEDRGFLKIYEKRETPGNGR